MSNALFRKMWVKLLTAAATEAIGHRHDDNSKPPSVVAVYDFMAAAKAGCKSERDVAFGMQRVFHASDNALFVEATLKDGFVHGSYLAK